MWTKLFKNNRIFTIGVLITIMFLVVIILRKAGLYEGLMNIPPPPRPSTTPAVTPPAVTPPAVTPPAVTPPAVTQSNPAPVASVTSISSATPPDVNYPPPYTSTTPQTQSQTDTSTHSLTQPSGIPKVYNF